MTDDAIKALLAERYGPPVKQYKPERTPAPVAELLDLLKDGTDDEESHLREVG